METAVLLEAADADGAELTLPGEARSHMSAGPDMQPAWLRFGLRRRLSVLGRARALLATRSDTLAAAISPELTRTVADTLVAEVLPLLAACQFLEQQAPALLRPRRLGRKGLPFWLSGTDVRIERVALGTVLVISPANYPLFLGGVQVLQALAAGNAVIWKPGRGGSEIAAELARALRDAGLPNGVLRLTDESVASGISAIEAHPAKIFFTGSAQAGRAVQRLAAEQSIPVVAELSGADAVYVLPGAEIERVLEALMFGMRLNGSATCMAPRRLFLVGAGHEALLSSLRERFAAMDLITISPATTRLLEDLLGDALAQGAVCLAGGLSGEQVRPILVASGSAHMRLTQTDVFAPVLTVLSARDAAHAAQLDKLCPLALTACIFGPVPAARKLGAQLEVGSVLINDLIVPTADPRVSFGGRRGSGFGVTRGSEGLLEMTAIRTTSVRKSKSRRHFQATTPAHEEFFRGIIESSHAGRWQERALGLRRVARAAKSLR